MKRLIEQVREWHNVPIFAAELQLLVWWVGILIGLVTEVIFYILKILYLLVWGILILVSLLIIRPIVWGLRTMSRVLFHW